VGGGFNCGRYSVYLLYWYKSTNTDAASRFVVTWTHACTYLSHILHLPLTPPALTSHTSLPDSTCSHTSHSHSTTSDALQRDTPPHPGGKRRFPPGGSGADVHLVRFDKVKMEKSFVLAQRVEERLSAVVEALQVCTVSY